MDYNNLSEKLLIKEEDHACNISIPENYTPEMKIPAIENEIPATENSKLTVVYEDYVCITIPEDYVLEPRSTPITILAMEKFKIPATENIPATSVLQIILYGIFFLKMQRRQMNYFAYANAIKIVYTILLGCGLMFLTRSRDHMLVMHQSLYGVMFILLAAIQIVCIFAVIHHWMNPRPRIKTKANQVASISS